MNEILAALLSYLLLYKYVALFLIIFFSAVILPLPDNTVLLAAGAFASQGYLNFWLSFITVLLANVLGDCFDYSLARRYGPAITRRLHVRIPWYIDRLDKYIRGHPRRTIFFTRFIGTADVVANLLAGFINVPLQKFLLWDTLGNIFSLFYILYLGYFLGIYWTTFAGILSVVGWIFFVIFAIAVIAIISGYRPPMWRKKASSA
jgi:membrane protein DedA with SNARE-associated domain